MIRIDNRTVELTPREQALSAMFERQLDIGSGIAEAVAATRWVADETGEPVDEAFWAWLGQ